MESATAIFRNRIALAFDFDGTLGPSTYDAVLEKLGFDSDEFGKEEIDPLLEAGWERALAQAWKLSEISRGRIERRDGKDGPVTEEFLASVGREMELYPGVDRMFDCVREAARAASEGVEVDFYLITAGFTEVAKATSIASEFRKIYGGAYHFDRENGGVAAAKRLLTHPEKQRYLLQLAKGMEEIEGANPSDAFAPKPMEEWRVPIDQFVYVGDGLSDLPVFEFLSDRGGIAIGVYRGDTPDAWRARDKLQTQRLVQNLAANDYSEGSELLRSLILATECVAKRIALREMSRGDDSKDS